MPLQTTNITLADDAYAMIRNNAAGWKDQLQNALASLQAGSVDSDFVFHLLDQMRGAVTALNLWKVTFGLDALATSRGYVGTMSADCTSVVTGIQTCIAWIAANFPTSGGFLQSHTLNADGSRTPRSFTSAQTLGLQTNLTSLIALLS